MAGMFRFFGKSQPRHLSTAITQAIAKAGLPSGMQAASLSVLEEHGSYSGRRVTYFRVFDPVRVSERSLQVRAFADLDGHPELILGEGHVEQKGDVVLTRHDNPYMPSAFSRTDAVRADHADDEQFVFPDRVS
jgi:hypothetical protein